MELQQTALRWWRQSDSNLACEMDKPTTSPHWSGHITRFDALPSESSADPATRNLIDMDDALALSTMKSIDVLNGAPQVWRLRSRGSATSQKGFYENFLGGRDDFLGGTAQIPMP